MAKKRGNGEGSIYRRRDGGGLVSISCTRPKGLIPLPLRQDTGGGGREAHEGHGRQDSGLIFDAGR